MSYYFKQVNADNIKDIQYLIHKVYNQLRDIEVIKKKYNTGVFGSYTIGYLAYAEEDDEPAGYYGVFPCQFIFQNQVYYAAQSGDTMTHPNHRKKGLFVTLAKKTYEKAKEIGVNFVFGFPGEASYYGFVKKLDWTHTHDIFKYSFLAPCIPYALIQRVISPKFLIDWYGFILKPLKSSTYPYSNDNSPTPHLLRNNDFYDYKDKKGNYNIKFLGVNIWFQIKGYNLIIADVAINNYTPSQIIFKLRVLAFFLGLPRIQFHVSENSNLNLFLRGKYKNTKGLAIGYTNLLEHDLPLDKLNFTYSDFDTF